MLVTRYSTVLTMVPLLTKNCLKLNYYCSLHLKQWEAKSWIVFYSFSCIFNFVLSLLQLFFSSSTPSIQFLKLKSSTIGSLFFSRMVNKIPRVIGITCDMDTRASFTFNIKQHRVIEHEYFERYFSHFYTTREIVLHLHYVLVKMTF